MIYNAWLKNELENLFKDMKNKALKEGITSNTNAEEVCLRDFDPPTKHYNVYSSDSDGARLIKTYRQKFIIFINERKNSIVPHLSGSPLEYRELLISLVKPIYKKVGESGYFSVSAFEIDVKAAKDGFFLNTKGTLADEIWQRFNVQIPIMTTSVLQSLQAIPFNGKTQHELECDIAESKGFIEAIARVARGLGLSHTSEIPIFSHIVKNSAGERENLYINDMWDVSNDYS